jgi:hypothetical protein
MANLLQPKTVTQNTTSAPPKYAQPGLQQLANDTMSLYNSGAGYQQYPGSGVAPMSWQTQSGINQLGANASNPNDPATKLYGSSANGLLNLSNNGGLNATQSGALGKMQDLYNQGGMNATQQDALAKMNDLYGQNDQNFQSSLDFQNQKIADAVNRQFQGMGAYGGTDYAKALTGELAGNSAQALSNQFNNSQQLKAGLANSILGAGQNAYTNQANLANNLFSGGQQGVNNQQSIAGLLPSLQTARDYNANQLLGAGALQDTYGQNILNDQIQKFNDAQSSQRQRISDATGLLSGVVGDYGTKSTAGQTPSLAQSVFGYLLSNAGNAAKAFGGGA